MRKRIPQFATYAEVQATGVKLGFVDEPHEPLYPPDDPRYRNYAQPELCLFFTEMAWRFDFPFALPRA